MTAVCLVLLTFRFRQNVYVILNAILSLVIHVLCVCKAAAGHMRLGGAKKKSQYTR